MLYRLQLSDIKIVMRDPILRSIYFNLVYFYVTNRVPGTPGRLSEIIGIPLLKTAETYRMREERAVIDPIYMEPLVEPSTRRHRYLVSISLRSNRSNYRITPRPAMYRQQTRPSTM